MSEYKKNRKWSSYASIFGGVGGLIFAIVKYVRKDELDWISIFIGTFLLFQGLNNFSKFK